MSDRPNVVIIMTDQQRADLCRREGFPLDTTPFLDRLATQGVWFDKAYTTMPACAPARISMLTGRYPSATRTRTNHNVEDATYTQDLFQLFSEHGYRTALCGKNHTYLRPGDVDYWYGAGHLRAQDGGESPEFSAFDAFMGGLHFHLSLEPTPFPVECQFPSRVVSRAQQWVCEKHVAGQPFFAWISFPEPHNPYQVSEPYYSLFPPESLPPTLTDESALSVKGEKYQWCRRSFEKAFPGFGEQIPRARSNYLGMLRLIDDQVKRFVRFLEEEGLREETILIFLSDHGDFVGEYGLMRKGPELPEALTRMPLIVTGPGIERSTSPHPAHVSMADILPTLCEVIGAEMPEGTQGRSLWPLLTGQDYLEDEFASAYGEHGFGGLHYTLEEPLDPAKDGLRVSPNGEAWGAYDCLNSWTQSGTMRMVRKDDWKLVFDMQGVGQLYYLPEDPAEMENLYGRSEFAEKQQELMVELLAWTLRTQDPLPLPRRRYVMKRDPRNDWHGSSSSH